MGSAGKATNIVYPPGTREGYVNLVASQKSNTTVDIDADKVVLTNSSGVCRYFGALNETLDITASGANGLDTGAEGSSRWYHLWAIGKEDGTLDGILSESATAPALPAGYTYKLYLGGVYNNSSSNLLFFSQKDKNVSFSTAGYVLSGGTQTNFTAVNLATNIPPTARFVYGFFSSDAGSKNSYIAPLAASGSIATYCGASSMYSGFFLPIITAQTLYYKVDSGGGCAIWISGWGY